MYGLPLYVTVNAMQSAAQSYMRLLMREVCSSDITGPQGGPSFRYSDIAGTTRVKHRSWYRSHGSRNRSL